MIHIFKNQNDVSVQVDLLTIEKIQVHGEDPKGIIRLVLGPYTIKVKASPKLVNKVRKDSGMEGLQVEDLTRGTREEDRNQNPPATDAEGGDGGADAPPLLLKGRDPDDGKAEWDI